MTEHTMEHPAQSIESVRNRQLDFITKNFWADFEYLDPYIIGLDDYKKRSSVLVLYAGNNANSGELMIGATRTDLEHNHIQKFVDLILEVVPKYNYKTVIFDRTTEALHDHVIKNLDYISKRVLEHYPDLCMICTSGTINSKDYQANCPGVHLVGTAHFLRWQSVEFKNVQYNITSRPRVFLNLNRVAKIPRLYALAELIKQGLLPHSLTSFCFTDDNGAPLLEYSKIVKDNIFNCVDHGEIECGGIPKERRIEIMTYITDVVNEHIFSKDLHKTNMVVDRPDVYSSNPAYIAYQEQPMFNDTWFSLVNETHTNIFYGTNELKNGVFISEKTSKVLAHKHPFFMFSTQGHLRELRNLGFKTFSDIWDESYDLITDPLERYDAILKEIDRLCGLKHSDWVEMHKKLEPIVNHNHNVFFNQSFKMVNIDKPIILP